ncbi:MAG: acyltransferase [Steroidobacteraceae bacterium]
MKAATGTTIDALHRATLRRVRRRAFSRSAERTIGTTYRPRAVPQETRFLHFRFSVAAVRLPHRERGSVKQIVLNAAKPSVDRDITPSRDAGRFLALDGLRGIAAFAVILDHVYSWTLSAWFPGRYLAVDFFFVLSGFVLAHAHGQKLAQGALSPSSFMRIRIIRLYPFYVLGLAFGLLLPILAVLHGWENASPLPEIATVAAFGLLFLPAPKFSWTGDLLYPFNGPSWSLFFELVANLIYGFIARYLTWLVLGVGLAVMAVLVAVTVLRHDALGPGWVWSHFDAGLSRVIYGFFAGVAVYKLRGVVKLPALSAWMSVVVLLVIFAVRAPGILRHAFDAFAAIVLMPLLVAVASGAKVSGVAARLCDALGLLSYGVYALHFPMMYLVDFGLKATGVSVPYGFMNVALVAMLTAMIAAVATRFYDAPFRKLLHRTCRS